MTSKRGYTKREWDAINAYNDVTMKRLREEIRESISTGVWNHGLWVSLHIWGIRAATDNDVKFYKKSNFLFQGNKATTRTGRYIYQAADGDGERRTEEGQPGKRVGGSDELNLKLIFFFFFFKVLWKNDHYWKTFNGLYFDSPMFLEHGLSLIE